MASGPWRPLCAAQPPTPTPLSCCTREIWLAATFHSHTEQGLRNRSEFGVQSSEGRGDTMLLGLDSRDCVTSITADTLTDWMVLPLNKPPILQRARGPAPGPLPSPHTCPGYLLIRGLSRRVHASMAQLLPMARAWLPCHQGGLGNRGQNQFGKVARRFWKCRSRGLGRQRLLCCGLGHHKGQAACGSLHLPPGGILFPVTQIIPNVILRTLEPSPLSRKVCRLRGVPGTLPF